MMNTPNQRPCRKSIGGRRGSIGGIPHSTPATPFLDVPENNDDAERRQRQLSRLQQLQTSRQVGSPVSSDRRKSIASLEPRLTGQQLAQHYAKCIQLSAENKISVKNAFNLQLIDYMTEMLRTKDSNMNNFQVASCTLDASAKIYAYRVDCIHTDTMRMAGGLGRTQDKQQQREDGDPNDSSQPSNHPSKRKRKKTATLETNPNNLTLSSLELDFMVDPLFKKISSQFDEGRAGGGLFLNSLSLKDDNCMMMLDSLAVPNDRTPTFKITDEQATIPHLCFTEQHLICPSFCTFHFNNWKVDDEDAFEQSFKKKSLDHETHAFDMNAVPEPLDDVINDPIMEFGTDDCAEMGDDFDSMVGNDGGNSTALTIGVAGQHYKSIVVPTMETVHLKEHLATMPLEYSYFDARVISAWAGPSHWKVKPAARDKSVIPVPGGKEEKPVKKSENIEINYSNFSERLSEMENNFTVTKRMTKLSNNTIKLWSETNTTLPFDLHFDPIDFAKLYGRSDVVVRRQNGNTHQLTEEDTDKSVADFDNDMGVQDMNDLGQDDFDVPNSDVTMLFSQTMLPPPSQSQPGSEFLGDNLVAAPNRVAKFNIGYARTAKRMDMKKLKTTVWTILTDVTDTNKENNQNGANSKNESHEEVHEKEVMAKNTSINFSSVYKTLPSNLSSNMAENLSCPLAFIALLHLCNERSLILEADGKLEDFLIKQG